MCFVSILLFTQSLHYPLMYYFIHTGHTILLLISCMAVTLSVWHAALTEEYEEERTEEYTEIVETFQTSDDGGKTWKHYKKTTRITPEGTSENIELIEGTSCCMLHMDPWLQLSVFSHFFKLLFHGFLFPLYFHSKHLVMWCFIFGSLLTTINLSLPPMYHLYFSLQFIFIN